MGKTVSWLKSLRQPLSSPVTFKATVPEALEVKVIYVRLRVAYCVFSDCGFAYIALGLAACFYLFDWRQHIIVLLLAML
jgi:hypothetical protein